jgi:flagellin-like hook-associated protein FlgL
MVEISTLGLGTQSIYQIRNSQAQLSNLALQLSTGKISLNLADYSLTESRRILDFRSVVEKRTSYLDIINTIKPRLDVYDKTFTAVDKIGNEVLRMINTTQNSDNAQDSAVGEQIAGFMQQVQFYLNQKVSDRYIFAGKNYGAAPVGDLSALPVPPTDSSTPVNDPTLPTYASAAPGDDANAYFKDSAFLDDGYSVSYGISSNDAAFQKLVLGMRWAYSATQDSANFSTYMGTARDLVTSALSDMRSLHGNVISNLARVNDAKDLHNRFIAEARAHIDDIQHADSANVATKISFVQAQLQATYSATAKIASLSLTNYL